MNTLDALFSWFTSATIRGTLLALAVVALQAALRGRLPARWNYALWLPVVFVLAAPWLPQSRWSLESRFARTPIQTVPAATSTAFDPQLTFAEAAPVAMSTTPVAHTDWHPVAQAAWLAGVVGFLAFALAGYARTMRRMRRGQVPADAELVAMTAEATAASGLRRAPRLLVSTSVQSPAVTGFWRPLLLLPADFPGMFTPSEARLVLLHELAHLKRHDLPLNWLLCLLQAIHCCNPLLWFAFARMRADREAACDARVLALTGAHSRAEYGGALLKLEGSFAQPGFSLGLVGIFERAAGMRARIRAIASYRSSRPQWGVLAAALIAALSMAGATRAQQSVPGEQTKPQAARARTDSTADDKAASASASIPSKLKAIIIPRLEFRETSLQEAFEFLRRKSVELDTAEPDVSKRGVNIVLNLQAPLTPGAPAGPPPSPSQLAESRITVSLTNIPFMEALRYIAGLANLKFRMHPNAIEVVPQNAVDPLLVKEWKADEGIRNFVGNTPKQALTAEGVPFPSGSDAQILADGSRVFVKNTQPNLDLVDVVFADVSSEPNQAAPPGGTKAPDAAAQINAKLKSIIIPRLQFRGATVREAVDFLKRKSIDLDTVEPDPAKRGVNFVLRLSPAPVPPGLDIPGSSPARANPADARVTTASLKDIPLVEALRYVTGLANMKFKVEESAVVIMPSSIDEDLLTKEWKLDDAMQTALALGTSSQTAKAALTAKGVTFPPGAAAFWTPAGKKLIVRDTQENVDAIDVLVSNAR